MVLQTMTSEKTPLESFSLAGWLKTACVQQAYTSRAPIFCRTAAAFVIVPGTKERLEVQKVWQYALSIELAKRKCTLDKF